MGGLFASFLPDIIGTGLGQGTTTEISDFGEDDKTTDNTGLIIGVVAFLAMVAIIYFLIKAKPASK